ncbi:MAG: hypothetical protein NC240_11010 [Clostridium sp.]|nr:hypothetical protein [Clostridium sp.]
MYSVTKRIKQVKQPMGGYIKPSDFNIIKIDDGLILNESENVHATVIGMAVDYLTRFCMGTPVKEAFRISIQGAELAEIMFKQSGALKKIEGLLSEIKGLDEKSIINACKMVTYDVWRRNPIGAIMAKGADETNPDTDTVKNIEIMVKRSVEFFKKYGPITTDGFTFEGGYTDTVSSGDGDFLTKDTLWDFKVSKSKPNKDHTLQLLMYYIMGNHSIHEEFKEIKKLGIFNPRLNIVYLLEISDIPKAVLEEVEKDVIGY